jgi:pimeloyl-ACP methyl ester carboxylesterase
MPRNGKVSAALALCCTVAGVALAGCDEAPEASPQPSTSAGATNPADDSLTGTKKIQIDGRAVNVSCSGTRTEDRPVIVLLLGAGDGLDKMAGLQRTLSEKDRVCSYDRLGAGASDQPGGPQTLDDTGKTLTAVIDRVAGDAPVVLAGHSLGGLIAARYAPDHQDRVTGLVLMDATSPTQTSRGRYRTPPPARRPTCGRRRWPRSRARTRRSSWSPTGRSPPPGTSRSR